MFDRTPRLSRIEIQDIITANSLTPVWDHTAAVKYITWNSNQWVSYDDADTFSQVTHSKYSSCWNGLLIFCSQKIAYANKQGLGGLMVWSADQDDTIGSALSSLVGSTPRVQRHAEAPFYRIRSVVNVLFTP